MNQKRFSFLSRREDPDTSRLGAEYIKGKLTKAQERAANVLLQNPALTAAELDQVNGSQDGQIRKRLAELERAGKARRGGKRTCTVTGRLAYVWYKA